MDTPKRAHYYSCGKVIEQGGTCSTRGQRRYTVTVCTFTFLRNARATNEQGFFTNCTVLGLDEERSQTGADSHVDEALLTSTETHHIQYRGQILQRTGDLWLNHWLVHFTLLKLHLAIPR